MAESNKNLDDKFEEFFDLISKATVAEIDGQYLASVYLYLAAYESAKEGEKDTLDNALLGMHNAWKLALGLKERPLCEHIFGILCKHLNDEDLVPYSEDLHELMLQKLEDFGLPAVGGPEDLDVDDLFDKIKGYVNSMNKKFPDALKNVEAQSTDVDGKPKISNADISKKIEDAKKSSADKFNDDEQNHDSNDGVKASSSQTNGANNLQNKIDNNHDRHAQAPNKNNANKLSNNDGNLNVNNHNNHSHNGPLGRDTYVVKKDVLRYRDLIGYDKEIQFMRSKGLGPGANNQYSQLIKKLNAEHGLDRVSFSDSLIFRSKSRTDAKIFMEATAGETGLPAIHMHLDESISGGSVLCMMAPADSDFKLNPGRTGFNGKGILMLEDVDTWDFPTDNEEAEDGMGAFIAAQISRGVAEIMNLIDYAIDDPNIIVMASVNDDKENEIMLRRVFGQFHIVDINYPTEMERAAIWSALANDHPSLRAFNIDKLVKYSENMSRYDINVAVHDALEDAYKQGLEKREYVPLTLLNITEKLAEHQPLESSEYKKLEDAATAEFKKSLENIDDILK